LPAGGRLANPPGASDQAGCVRGPRTRSRPNTVARAPRRTPGSASFQGARHGYRERARRRRSARARPVGRSGHSWDRSVSPFHDAARSPPDVNRSQRLYERGPAAVGHPMTLCQDSRARRSRLVPQPGHLLASLSGVAFVRRSTAAAIGAGGSHERGGTSALQTGQWDGSSLLMFHLLPEHRLQKRPRACSALPGRVGRPFVQRRGGSASRE
jgi:hypothetical protein